MNNIAALHELLSTRLWCASVPLVHATRDFLIAIRTNPDGIEAMQQESIITLVAPLAIAPVAVSCDQSQDSNEPTSERDYYHLDIPAVNPYTQEAETRHLHLMEISGGILRNSGMCSAGSMDQRDELIQAANDGCDAHIIIINSGGGQATSMLDYEDGIRYCREHGQPVIAWVRGGAYSCAYSVAMMCDRLICSSRVDGLGCIGALIAGFFQTDGDKNAITQETYREWYATQSPDKNGIIRRAKTGDDAELQQQLDECAQTFLDLVQQYRPQVTEEQRRGGDWPASEVIGTLCDEIGDFSHAVDTAISLAEDAAIQQRKAGTTAH